MELSTFAAIIGFAELLVAIPLITAPKHSLKWMESFMNNTEVLRYLGAALVLIAGPTLVHQNTISNNLAGIVVLFAWVTLLKGFLLAWMPEHVSPIQRWYLHQKCSGLILGSAALSFSILLITASTLL